MEPIAFSTRKHCVYNCVVTLVDFRRCRYVSKHETENDQRTREHIRSAAHVNPASRNAHAETRHLAQQMQRTGTRERACGSEKGQDPRRRSFWRRLRQRQSDEAELAEVFTATAIIAARTTQEPP